MYTVAMSVLSYNAEIPRIDPSVFLAHGVQIIGDVEIGKDSGCWYNAVIRGDVNAIRIGSMTNIQDGVILHVSYNTQPLIIGNGVTVGHNAVLHSCSVEDHSLIGMAACILDGAIIQKYAMVGAGTLVSPNMKIPSGTLAVGVPARVVRKLTDEEIYNIETSAQRYHILATEHQKAEQQTI